MIDSWAADPPTGYGFLGPLTGRPAKVNNQNLMELDDPAVNRLLGEGLKTRDPERRAGRWANADRKIMESAAFVPFIDEKSLLYRPDTLRNVYVHPAYGMYDLAALGRE